MADPNDPLMAGLQSLPEATEAGRVSPLTEDRLSNQNWQSATDRAIARDNITAGQRLSDIGNEMPTGIIAEMVMRPGFSPDPTWSLDAYDEALKNATATSGLPPQWIGELSGAVSQEHFDAILARAKAGFEREQRMADAGFGWGVANFAAQMFDPASWAIAGGAMVPAIVAMRAAKAGNLAWVAGNAAAGAVGNVGIEAVRDYSGRPVDESDYLWAAGAGLVFGGGLSMFMKNPNLAAEASIMGNAGRQMIKAAEAARARYKTTPLPAEMTPSGVRQAAAEAAPLKPDIVPDMPAPVAEPIPAADPLMSNGSAAREAPLREAAEAVMDQLQVPEEARAVVRQAVATVEPEAPLAAAVKEVPTGPVEVDLTPAQLKNTRILSHWKTPDGEYTIMAQTSDLSGPYMIRKAGEKEPFARDLDTLKDAKAALPQGTAADPAVVARDVMAQLAPPQAARPLAVEPLPKLGIELGGDEATGYTFKGFRYTLDAAKSDEGYRVFHAMKGNKPMGKLELEKVGDRWKIGMIVIAEPYKGNGSVLGLLKIAENYAQGARIPDGILLKDGFDRVSKYLPWVKEWYRRRPEPSLQEAYYSPKELLLNRELAARNIENSPKATPDAKRRMQSILKAYDEAIASLPPEATAPENLRMMFEARDPMRELPPVAPQVHAAVREVLDRITPASFKSIVGDTLPPEVQARMGGTQARAVQLSQERLIYIALQGNDNPLVSAYHETLHAYRTLGLVDKNEWLALRKWARADKELRAEVEGLYGPIFKERGYDPKIARDLMDEEVIAHALSRYLATGKAPNDGIVTRVFDKLVDVLRTIRDALGINGWRTVQDIADDFKAGKIAQRPENYDARPGDGVMAQAQWTEDTRPFQAWLADDGTWASITQADAPRAAYSRWRFDRAGVSMNTENAAARKLANLVMNNSVGNEGHAVNPFSMDQDQRRLQAVFTGFFDRHLIPAYDKWAKDLKLGPVERKARMDEFFTEVGLHVSGRGDPGKVYHPAVEQFSKHVRTALDEAALMYQNPRRIPFSSIPEKDQPAGRGILGSDKLVSDNYLWRKLNGEQVIGMINRVGEKGVISLVKAAIAAKNPAIDPNVLNTLGKGYVRSILKRSQGLGDEWSVAVGEGNAERLRELLQDTGGLRPDEIEGVVRALIPDPKGDTTNMKTRVFLDESAQVSVRDLNGEPVVIHFRDLLDNNVMNLFEGYIRRASGRWAMGRLKWEIPDRGTKPGEIGKNVTLIDGITSLQELQEVLARVQKWGVDNLPGYNADLVKRDTDYLKFAFDRILAVPDPSEMGDFAQYMRDLREFNVIRLMGGVGVSQLGETGTAVASLGLKAAFSHVPAYKRLITALGESRLGDDLFHELEHMGIGVERLHGIRFKNLDVAGDLPFEVRPHSTHDRVSRDLKLAGNATYELSGMSVIQQQQQRAVAAGIAQKFADLAERVNNGKAIPKGWERRLAQLGIDPDMAQRIFKELGKAETTDGIFFKHKLTRLNVDKWDPEPRAAFEAAIWRFTNKVVQQGDVGSAAFFMTTPLVKTALQFRSFPLIAWQNQFLHNIHMRDPVTASVFVWSVAWAAAVRAAQISLLAAGRSDRKEYLEKNLTPLELAKAGFQRSGWSSIIPPIMDTGAVLTGNKAIFNARTSGQPGDFLFGSPTISMFNDGIKNVGSLVGAGIEGRAPSQAEVRGALMLTPWSNMMPLAQLYSGMISGLPEMAPPKR